MELKSSVTTGEFWLVPIAAFLMIVQAAWLPTLDAEKFLYLVGGFVGTRTGLKAVNALVEMKKNGNGTKAAPPPNGG